MLQVSAVLDTQESQLKVHVQTLLKTTKAVYSYNPDLLSSMIDGWKEAARTFEDGAALVLPVGCSVHAPRATSSCCLRFDTRPQPSSPAPCLQLGHGVVSTNRSDLLPCRVAADAKEKATAAANKHNDDTARSAVYYQTLDQATGKDGKLMGEALLVQARLTLWAGLACAGMHAGMRFRHAGARALPALQLQLCRSCWRSSSNRAWRTATRSPWS